MHQSSSYRSGIVAVFFISLQLILFSMLSVGKLYGQRPEAKIPGKNPNFLFCIADDASMEHMQAYGLTDWVKTPGFDRIAREGLLFMNVYTPNAKCSPSRASILTGRNPWQLEEAANHNSFFPSKYISIMEALAVAGYKTGFTGKGWGPGNPGKIGGKPRLLTGSGYNRVKMPTPTMSISPNNYTANFEQFLHERKESEPFFFWYGGFEPHRTYEKGSGVSKGRKKLGDIDKVPDYWIDNEVVRNDMLDYAFELEYFDSHLLKMIQLLEEMGELENTIIIVTSDNGMPFPRVKGHVYEAANHLPFAMMWKNHIPQAGKKIQDFISFIDLAPTILQLAAIPEKASGMQPMEGKSFVDLLFSKQNKTLVDPKRDYVLLGRERTDVGRPHDWGYPVRGIVQNGYIYTRNFEPGRWPAGNPETGYLDVDNGPTKKELLKQFEKDSLSPYFLLSFGKRPAEELYHIAADTFCMTNLANDKKYLAVLTRMRGLMEKELIRQKDPRILGNGVLFDQYPYAKPESRNFYERFMKGEIKNPRGTGGD